MPTLPMGNEGCGCCCCSNVFVELPYTITAPGPSCPDHPLQYTVNLSGVDISACCDVPLGTKTLTWVSSVNVEGTRQCICQWLLTTEIACFEDVLGIGISVGYELYTASEGLPAQTFQMAITLTFPGDVDDEARYTLASGSWDCDGNNTLSLYSTNLGAGCTTFPANLTLVPV